MRIFFFNFLFSNTLCPPGGIFRNNEIVDIDDHDDDNNLVVKPRNHGNIISVKHSTKNIGKRLYDIIPGAALQVQNHLNFI